MPRPALRSRHVRRVKTRTPKGVLVTRFERERPSASKCALCKAPVKGTAREVPYRLHKMAKTQRRPNRPYSNFCSSCMRRNVKEKFLGG